MTDPIDQEHPTAAAIGIKLAELADTIAALEKRVAELEQQQAPADSGTRCCTRWSGARPLWRQHANHWRAITRPGWECSGSNSVAGDFDCLAVEMPTLLKRSYSALVASLL
jgi:hypothetical protein